MSNYSEHHPGGRASLRTRTHRKFFFFLFFWVMMDLESPLALEKRRESWSSERVEGVCAEGLKIIRERRRPGESVPVPSSHANKRIGERNGPALFQFNLHITKHCLRLSFYGTTKLLYNVYLPFKNSRARCILWSKGTISFKLLIWYLFFSIIYK